MALNKVTYVDYQTVVTAANMNAIQDEIISTTCLTTCNTAAATAAKSAVLAGFVLSVGASIKVKFTNSNTASNPTLNVSSTGAKPIVKYGATNVGQTEYTSWTAGEVVELVYDGTSYVMVGRSKETTRADIEAASTSDLADVAGMVSDSYSASKTYLVGDYCIKDNILYKCKTAITTAEAWNSSHWTATTVAAEIKHRTLFLKGVAVSVASSGTIINKSDSRITANHTVSHITFANQSAITSELTCTPSAGKVVVTGTCTTATTADIWLEVTES